SFKRQTAGRHFVENHSEREQIGARIQFFTQRLLRTHIGNRAQRSARRSQVVDAGSDRGTGRGSRCIQNLAAVGGAFSQSAIQGLGVEVVVQGYVGRFTVGGDGAC